MRKYFRTCRRVSANISQNGKELRKQQKRNELGTSVREDHCGFSNYRGGTRFIQFGDNSEFPERVRLLAEISYGECHTFVVRGEFR